MCQSYLFTLISYRVDEKISVETNLRLARKMWFGSPLSTPMTQRFSFQQKLEKKILDSHWEKTIRTEYMFGGHCLFF